MPAILVQCPLNGGRTRDEHPAIPTTPQALAASAADAAAAGARSFHVHPRDSDGAESLRPERRHRVRAGGARRVPRHPRRPTTNVWGVEHGPERLELVRAWEHATLPDFCSVNLEEVDAIELMELLLGRNVGIEAGLSSARGCRAPARQRPGRELPARLVEPITEDPEEALRQVGEIEDALGDLPVPQLHHGDGPATWAVIERALPAGRDIRIGLEDTLTLPDGRAAADNADLVAAAFALLA